MTFDAGPNRPVKSLNTLCIILNLLQELNGAGPTELAQKSDIAKSTIHDHLSTLYEKEYLIKRGNEYHLSLKFLDHGMFVKENTPLYQESMEKLRQTAKQTGEIAWLVVEEHGWAVNLASAEGEYAVRSTDRVGRRSHLHYQATGKAILSALPKERITNIIDRHGLPNKTESTITNKEKLFKELEKVRDQGFALNDQEEIEGFRAVGSPIIVHNEVLGAVGVAGPANRLTGDRFRNELPEYIKGTANEIELDMTY